MKSNTVGRNADAWKVALEDAVVTGLITLASGLLAGGYPPRPEILYISAINALLVGLYGWARARGIKRE